MTRTTTTVAAVLITGAVVTATAGPAAAAPVRPGASRPFAITTNGRVVPLDDDTSPVAGYAADLSASTLSRRTVTETFTVPAVKCTARTTNVLFVSLFLQGTDTAGDTLVDEGYVVVSCQGKTPTYQLFASAAGGDPNGVFGATAAGDTVRIDLAATTGTETSTLTDVTTGATASQTGTGITANYMQASVQGGDGHSVFPKFTKVHFTKVVAVGKTLQALHPEQFSATDAGDDVKIQAGPLDSTGRGFTDTFVANFSPPA